MKGMLSTALEGAHEGDASMALQGKPEGNALTLTHALPPSPVCSVTLTQQHALTWDLFSPTPAYNEGK